MNEPIWLSVARFVEGIHEIPGPTSEPMILRWARDIGAPDWYHDDDQPWCAVFANRLMLACQLPMSGTGFDLIRAKSFATWGLPCEPTLGAVLVFSRPEGHHVGLYLGERADAFYVLGGNTRNVVGATWIAKDRLRACRWPASVPLALIHRVHLADDGSPVSGDEA